MEVPKKQELLLYGFYGIFKSYTFKYHFFYHITNLYQLFLSGYFIYGFIVPKWHIKPIRSFSVDSSKNDVIYKYKNMDN